MKIVQVLAMEGSWGGIENHTFELSKELAKNHEVHLILGEKYKGKMKSVENLYYHYLDFARNRWNILLLWQLKSLINHIQPDLVHAQAGKAAELIAKIRAWLKPVKFVSTVHGTKKNKSAYAAADAVIAVSQALTQGIPPAKAHVIYNGVYAQPMLSDQQKQQLKAEIYAQHPALDASRKIVMCIGRLEPVKNVSLLLQAMQGIQANLWIVGDGSLRQSLEGQAQQSLQHQAAFLGFRSDARDLIQLADAVVLSSDREGFPLVMVEALQADKTMASTKVNGVIEWLPAPYLAGIGQADELHDAIMHALSKPAQAEFQPLFARAKAELTVQAMAGQTLNIYEQLLKK